MSKIIFDQIPVDMMLERIYLLFQKIKKDDNTRPSSIYLEINVFLNYINRDPINVILSPTNIVNKI